MALVSRLAAAFSHRCFGIGGRIAAAAPTTAVIGIGVGLALLFISPSGALVFPLTAGIAMLLTVCGGMAWALRRAARAAPVHKAKQDRVAFLRLAARPVPRVLRMMRIARDAGLDVFFVGALRDPRLATQDSWEGFQVFRVGRLFPLVNGRKPWLYLRSVLDCNWGFLAVLRRQQPSIVHASDFEAMPAGVLYRLTRRCRLVYNIHDNLALRYGVPRPLAWCLNALEGLAILLADESIIPEEFRRSNLPRWCRHKVVVVRNLPPDSGPAPPRPFENGRIRLFYGGWLDWQRGIGALLTLAKEPDIEIRIAGEGAPEIVDQLKQVASITYLGFVDSKAIIEETRQCHFVPVLYDPARTINRLAAPNKLAEALSIGRPIILNSELEIANMVAGYHCVIDTKYSEAATIAAKLRMMAADASAYSMACANARQTYQTHYSWERTRVISLRTLTGVTPSDSIASAPSGVLPTREDTTVVLISACALTPIAKAVTGTTRRPRPVNPSLPHG
jgi:glycosyltransferase involved in cell wall biosynthesis